MDRSVDSMDISDVVLPEDVLFHILLWLPVMSLFRFKSVCKSWLAHITSSDFINQHNRLHLWHGPTALEEDTKLIVKSPILSDDPHSGGINLSILTGDDFDINVPMDCSSPGFCKDICASFVRMFVCNGIVCLCRFYSECHIDRLWKYELDAFLWNPAMKQLNFLPKSNCPLPRDTPDSAYRDVSCSLGFGFDAKTNTHKVVKVSIMIAYNDDVPKSQVEVYTLSSDSWKVVGALPNDVRYILYEPTTPYNNETYCWMGKIGYPIRTEDPVYFQQNNHFIISFHFSSEVFELIPLPDARSVKFDPCPRLAFLRDNVACINSVDYGTHDVTLSFEIWVLLEYGVKESWTKLYKIGPYFSAESLGLLKNDNFILVIDRQLCMYDLLSQKIKNLPAQRYPYGIREIQVAVYKENLADVKRSNGAPNTIATRTTTRSSKVCETII